MQHEYDEMNGDVTDLCDDEQYFQHVICDDHELLAVDIMLCNAFSPVED